MARAFIGIGSNQGDRLTHIFESMRALTATSGVQVCQVAVMTETEPIGGPPQGRYLNTVVELETSLAPRELLRVLQDIERQRGRQPSAERWGPRPIDLDILLYEDRVVHEQDLTVPHPRMHERRFVLEPLAQLAPAIVHPVLKKTIGELLSAARC